MNGARLISGHPASHFDYDNDSFYFIYISADVIKIIELGCYRCEYKITFYMSETKKNVSTLMKFTFTCFTEGSPQNANAPFISKLIRIDFMFIQLIII